MESKVITAVYKDRDAFETIKPIVNGSSTSIFTDVDAILYEKALEYYDNDREAEYIDLDIIRSFINRVYPKQAEILNISLDRIEGGGEVSANNLLREFIEEKKYVVGQQLAGALLAGKNATELMEEYNLLDAGEVAHTSDDVVIHSGLQYQDIAVAMDKSSMIELYPQELQERTGGAMRGHHILIFARPETGKTLFTINFVRGFLDQGLKVLYIGNEDNEKAMLPRCVGCFIGANRKELEELSEEEVNDGLNQANAENFHFAHLEPGTFHQIRGLIRTIKPDVVVVDQIRNVQTGGDGLTTGLERAGTEMRNIGNEFDVLAISITQAGESAQGKLVLGLSDIDSSKTGLPAQVDLMVGLGVTEDYEGRSKRMVSLPKNKISGDHSYFSITVDESRSRVL